MTKGIERTCQAIISNEKIGIFGDYDVDGATSTAAFYQDILNQLSRKMKYIFLIDQLKVTDHQKKDLINC